MELYKKIFRVKPGAFLVIIVAALAVVCFLKIFPSRGGGDSHDNADTVMRMYNEYRQEFPDIEEIGAADAIRLSDEGKVLFVDLREKKEREISMLPGAITEKEFLENMDKLGDQTVVVYCTIGYRSGKFAQKMKKKGFKVLNLKGGILAWVHAGGQVYDQKGKTNRVHVYGSTWNLLPPGYEAVW